MNYVYECMNYLNEYVSTLTREEETEFLKELIKLLREEIGENEPSIYESWNKVSIRVPSLILKIGSTKEEQMQKIREQIDRIKI